MEEDIKILEDFIKYFEAEALSRKYRRNISITVGEDDIEAIENLINRNKELEKIEQKHKEINGNLREKIKELEEENHTLKEKIQMFIPRRRVRRIYKMIGKILRTDIDSVLLEKELKKEE